MWNHRMFGEKLLCGRSVTHGHVQGKEHDLRGVRGDRHALGCTVPVVSPPKLVIQKSRTVEA